LAACAALIAAELPAEALFHAQQCAEKAMKAVLTWRQVPFGKTHDLDEPNRRAYRWPETPPLIWPA
jgi:HEPN domain-containing protein